MWSLLQSLFAAGGWVMYPLLALSILAATLCFERLLFWARTHSASRSTWITQTAAALRIGDLPAVRALCSKDTSVYSDFTRGIMSARFAPSAVVEHVERVRPRIERFSSALSAIITAAPMLGILGTVVGIIDSFQLLGNTTTAVTDPTDIAAGIAQALYTTAFGLIIALTTLFPYIIFKAAADRCFTRLEVLIAAAPPLPPSSPSSSSPSSATAQDAHAARPV